MSQGWGRRGGKGRENEHLLGQELVQLVITPLQGQAGRCRSFLVVDAERSSATWLLQQEPRQPQQAQPNGKMHQCLPGAAICRGGEDVEKRGEKVKNKKANQQKGKVGEHHDLQVPKILKLRPQRTT